MYVERGWAQNVFEWVQLVGLNTFLRNCSILQQKQFVIRGEPVILPLNSELLLDLSDAIDPPRERERKRV